MNVGIGALFLFFLASKLNILEKDELLRIFRYICKNNNVSAIPWYSFKSLFKLILKKSGHSNIRTLSVQPSDVTETTMKCRVLLFIKKTYSGQSANFKQE